MSCSAADAKRRPAAFCAAMLVLFVSRAFRAMGLRACRFHPSCSEYSAAAFGRFGLFKAAGLTLGRLLRCHPLHAGGYDPLPVQKRN